MSNQKLSKIKAIWNKKVIINTKNKSQKSDMKITHLSAKLAVFKPNYVTYVTLVDLMRKVSGGQVWQARMEYRHLIGLQAVCFC